MSSKRVGESDLYEPVKSFLERQGYEVKAEIYDCDVVATSEETLIVVELKLMANLKLLLQAVERKSLTDFVYVAVPWDLTVLSTDNRSFLKLLRMLGLGLLLVDVEAGIVEAVVDPGEYKPRKIRAKRARLLREFEELVGDPNVGGSAARKGRMTVYRQKAIRIADYLGKNGPSKAAHVREALSIEKARDILYRNVYGWFEPHGKGIYSLSSRGARELGDWIN